MLAFLIAGIVIGVILYWIFEQLLGGVGKNAADSAWANKLAEAEATIGGLKQQLETALSQAATKDVFVVADRLQKVNGIGNVYAQKLNDAGIYTFAQLAEQSAARLTEIIAPESWQAIEPEAWIEEAASFAAGH
ncbi:MAG: DUF4332 domain-containing protein [Anaerolineales bacterium]|nr:DUF4332 domain-containing protein [Anaerolineales bacterium]